MNVVDPLTLGLMQRALDASALRHAAIAQNIANVGVPGAARASVNFEESLSQVRASLHLGMAVDPRDLPVATLEQEVDPAGINLEQEMSALSQNSMHYQVLLRALSRQLGMSQLALNEGKR